MTGEETGMTGDDAESTAEATFQRSFARASAYRYFTGA
jgi:hypothetical protein